MVLLTTERKQIILDLLQTQGSVQVVDLSERFGVSRSTVRRNLEALAKQNLLQRTYGGAIAIKSALSQKTRAEPCAEWEHVGQAAAALIAPNESVFIGPGLLCQMTARHLYQHLGLAIITNSLEVAWGFYQNSQLAVVVTGGPVERPGGGMSGAMTERALRNLRADKLLVEVTGISPIEGLTVDHLAQAQVLQSLLATTAELIVLAAPERLGRVGPAWLAPISEADVIVTGRDAAMSIVWDLSELGVQVTLV